MAPWAVRVMSCTATSSGNSKPMGFIQTLGVPGAAPSPGPAGTLRRQAARGSYPAFHPRTGDDRQAAMPQYVCG